MTTTSQLTTGSMTDLQRRWYESLLGGLGLSAQSFQVNLPATPLPPSDSALWSVQDAIPPKSLSFARERCHGDLLFAEYVAVITQLVFPESKFEADIGPETFAAWSAYVAGLPPPPPDADQLPAIFQQWAMLNAPSVAAIGTADLAQMALISDAVGALSPYLGPHAKTVDFARGYADLALTLAVSAGGKASLAGGTQAQGGKVSLAGETQKAQGGKVSLAGGTQAQGGAGAWAPGIGVDGLWATACPGSRVSRRFAASNVTVTADFAHVARWVSTPGQWYDSSLLATAWRAQGATPWPPDPNPTWAQVFGPGGSMRRVAAQLVVVDGLQATVSSDAVFRPADQQAILAGAPTGLWPFYLPEDLPGVQIAVTFDAGGALTIDVSREPGHPLVLGQVVTPINQFIGVG